MFVDTFLRNVSLIFVASMILAASCKSQEYHTWMSAKNSCTLVKDTSTLGRDELLIRRGLRQRERAWIGNRERFTDWLALKQCIRYVLTDSDSTVVPINGRSSLTECYDACRQRYNASYTRFGLSRREKRDVCVCDNLRSDKIFGSYDKDDTCRPSECSSGDNLDVCGNDTGIAVYSNGFRANFSNFQDSGKCGAFVRVGVDQFVGRSMDCDARLGHLGNPFTGAGDRYAVLYPTRSWKQTVMDVGVDSLGAIRLYDIPYPLPLWGNISLEEWPLNVYLWTAWTRRSWETEDGDCPDTCLCSAVYVDNTGTLQREMMNCTVKLRAVCEQNHVVPGPVSDSSTEAITYFSTTVLPTTLLGNKNNTFRATIASEEIRTTGTTGFTMESISPLRSSAYFSTTVLPTTHLGNKSKTMRTTIASEEIRTTGTTGFTMESISPLRSSEDESTGVWSPTIILGGTGGFLVAMVIIVAACKRKGRCRLKGKSKQDERHIHNSITNDQVTNQSHSSVDTRYVTYSSPSVDHNYEGLNNTEIDHTYLTIVDEETGQLTYSRQAYENGQPYDSTGQQAYEMSLEPTSNHVYTALR